MFRSYDTGFTVDFPNGWTVSVQWGAGNYSDNQTKVTSQTPFEGSSSRTAEVASWRTDARSTQAWYDGNPNGVQGHMDAGRVMEYIRMISDLEDAPQPEVVREYA